MDSLESAQKVDLQTPHFEHTQRILRMLRESYEGWESEYNYFFGDTHLNQTGNFTDNASDTFISNEAVGSRGRRKETAVTPFKPY